MKLAWYTPYSQYSAIGAFSREVVTALIEKGHAVTIIRCEKPNSCVSKTEAPHVTKLVNASSFQHDVPGFLADFDVVVYNVGNHFSNHYFSIEHQRQVPGVTLLHDYMLHHLLAEWCEEDENRSYLDVLAHEAGADSVLAFHAAAKNDIQKDWYMSNAARYPVLRFAMANTLGVVTHADFYSESTRKLLHCPVTTIPLAYPHRSETELETPTRTNGKLTLLTIGDVNINKRCESIIKSIASSPELAKHWRYRIAGRVTKTYGAHLMRLASEREVCVELDLLGAVDDAQLNAEVAKANAISCLRFPIIEGASASVVTSLASGRPTLVSQGGCYDEIPDSMVFRVAIDSELDSIQKHLMHIADNYEMTVFQAAKARAWVKKRHSGNHYATSLCSFLDSTIAEFPVIELADQIAENLSQWNWQSDCPVVNQLDGVINHLFRSTTSKSKAGI